MKLKMILILLWAVFLIFSCQKENSTEPGDENIHPQQDIPWPSLADSPWPVAHGNMQCTGRSAFKINVSGKAKWYFHDDDMLNLLGSPVIGESGAIYFTCYRGLYAMNPDGTLKWKFLPGKQVMSGPMVASGEVIYFSAGSVYNSGTSSGCYYALNADGSVRWQYQTDAEIYNYGEAIDLAGNIFFVDVAGNLYSLSPQGNLNWKTIGSSGFKGGGYNSISISPDGATLYVAGKDSTLNAVSAQTGEIEWKFPLGHVLEASALVDCEGNIYCFGFNPGQKIWSIYSLKPDGTVRWVFGEMKIWNLQEHADMHMDINGHLYFCKKDTLASLTYDGKLRWQIPIGNHAILSPILGDSQGNIVLATYANHILGFNNSGKSLFDCKIETSASNLINGAISADGLLYISESLNFYCIK